nr:hypothetical protein [Tanacetum cinerariifolium]
MSSYNSIVRSFASLGHDLGRDCVCSIGTVEDKILVPKPPKNCARYFQNSSEPSNAITNVVNAPREPYIVKQDNGSFVDKINFRAPDSPDQFHCFHCKDVLRAGEAYDNIISGLPPFSAITPDEPVLSTEEPDNSLSMGDEHLDTILATESDEFIKSGVENLIPIPNQIEDFSEYNKEFSSNDDDSFSIDDIDYVEGSPLDSKLVSSKVMEIVIPEVGGIDDDILLTIEHDVLREKLLNVNLLISKIKALNANPTLSSDCKTKSSSTSLNSLLEETNTFDNSLPKFETFCFDVEEISSSSTTTHPDISLPEYESFYDDHVKEISSGSPTTHYDSSLYASFMFDLSINPFPLDDKSDSYEFTDELIPFISAPEYDCFLFKVEPNSRDFTKDVVENISPTKEPQVLNALPTHPTLQLNLKFQPSSESLFAYVVWIFLPFLVNSVVPHYLLSLRTEDIIFDTGICKSTFSRPDISHRCRTVKKFNTHRSHLNKCPMLIHGQNNPPLDVLLFHFYPLDSLKYGGDLVQLI